MPKGIPNVEPTKCGLTLEQAQRALRALHRHLKAYKDAGERMPILILDDDESHYQISWEDGPYNWAAQILDSGLQDSRYHATQAKSGALILPAPVVAVPADPTTLTLCNKDL